MPMLRSISNVTANAVLPKKNTGSHHSENKFVCFLKRQNLHEARFASGLKRLRCNGIRVWQGLCFDIWNVVTLGAWLRKCTGVRSRAQKISSTRTTGRQRVLRILIADDHEVARHGIRALLEAHAGWDVCAEAKDGREAVE